MRADSGIYPPNGAVGRERRLWYQVARLKISSGILEVCDLGFVPTSSFRFRVPNGSYVIEAKLINFAGSLCVSRVRACLSDIRPTLGRKRGNINVDFSAVAIGDFQSVRATLDQAEQQELNRQVRGYMVATSCKLRTVKVSARSIRLVVCRTAEGDGSYPVFSLYHRGRCVGLEMEFFRNGHVLPPSPIPTVEFRRVPLHLFKKPPKTT